jgi:hypothetical protein
MFQDFFRGRGKTEKRKLERTYAAAVPTLKKAKRETALIPILEHTPIFYIHIYILNTNNNKVSKKAPLQINDLQLPQN